MVRGAQMRAQGSASAVRQQRGVKYVGGGGGGLVKRASTKRQAPSPPGRRVVSSDREERLVANGRAVYGHPEANYRSVSHFTHSQPVASSTFT